MFKNPDVSVTYDPDIVGMVEQLLADSNLEAELLTDSSIVRNEDGERVFGEFNSANWYIRTAKDISKKFNMY